MKDIVKEIAELRQAPVPALVARYRAVWGKEPRSKRKDWLWRRIAWKLQEERYGGLSRTAKKRLEELIGEIELPGVERTVRGSIRKPGKPGVPSVGTTLTRKWRDQEIRVQVREGGFEWNDKIYRSLSAVAKAITGAHWNGRLFFNLTGRKKP